MREIELLAGTIDYEDTGGAGPVVVWTLISLDQPAALVQALRAFTEEAESSTR